MTYDTNDLSRLLSDLTFVLSEEDVKQEILKYYNGGLLLEVGAGTCKIGIGLSTRTKQSVFLSDIDESALEFGRVLATLTEHMLKGRLNLNFFKDDALRSGFPDNMFSLVISEGVFEHFSESERPKFLAENYRILKKGGTLIVIIPNYSNENTEKHARTPHSYTTSPFEFKLSPVDMMFYLENLKMANVKSYEVANSLLFTVGVKT